MHVDCDEYEKHKNRKYLHPFCSSVTYFNDNPCPTIITPFNIEDYKYKDFSNETELIFSFPVKNKHIAFDGSKFHGAVALNSDIIDESQNNSIKSDITNPRYILAINLWDRKPSHISYYDKMIHENQMEIKHIEYDNTQYFTEDTLIQINEDPLIPRTLLLDNTIINFDFWEQILYHNSVDAFLPFKSVFDDQINYYIFDASGNFSLDNFIVKSSPQISLLQKQDIENKKDVNLKKSIK
jgi:hypothetical protein